MTVTIHPNGTGGVLGDELVTETELYTTGDIRYVHYTGDNANTGFSRQKPWASLVFALTQVTDNDIIVLLDAHIEIITAKQTISQNGLKIVGEGSDENGGPTVAIGLNLDSDNVLVISGTNVTLGNIWFPSQVVIPAALAKIKVTGDRSMIRGCYIESGAGDQYAPVEWATGADGCRVYNTTFVSVSETSQPPAGLVLGDNANCEVEACTFDGGTTGFVYGGILGGNPANFRAQQLNLLNGAGVSLDTPTGYVGISTKTGAPSVTGFARHLARGFAQTGDAMLADTEFYMSGTPFYVHYGTGDDGNSGTDELAPKKTVASAVSVLSEDCSIIVLLPSHVEPLTSEFGISTDGLTIIGCGTSDGKPTCRFYNADNADPLCSAFQIGYLRNIWFDKSTSESIPDSLVDIGADYVEMRGCLVTPGRAEIGVTAQSSFLTFRETKFESAGTAVATRPARGLSFSSESSMQDIDVRGCIFSNSQYGFSQEAFREDELARLYVISMTQSFGADVNINDTTTGIVNPETSSGSASVEWG